MVDWVTVTVELTLEVVRTDPPDHLIHCRCQCKTSLLCDERPIALPSHMVLVTLHSAPL